jgi:sortase B
MAWIRIDGTSVNYPIMYGTDNEYFLNHLPNGKKSKRGSIFIDYRNSPDFSDQNTMIHGHRMRSGAMFGALRHYANQSFYNSHSTVSIFTPEKNFDVKLFAGYTLNQTVETPPLRFRDAESFNSYIKNARQRSIFKSDVEVNHGDRLVTLATCEYSIKEGRLVLVGKLVEK